MFFDVVEHGPPRLVHPSRNGDGCGEYEKDCCRGDNGAAFSHADLGADWHIVVVGPRVDVHGGFKLFAFFDWRVNCRGGYGVLCQ